MLAWAENNRIASAPNWAEGTDAGVLAAIARPDINLAIWARDGAPDVAALLTGEASAPACACPDHGPAGITPDFAPAGVDRVLADLGFPPLPARGVLARDIAMLAARFGALTRAARLKLRVERMAHDGCRLFHTDYVRVRLITTYAGPGTEWLPDAAADRTNLGRGDNGAICRDAASIRRLGRGHVALFKGEAWPGAQGRAIVHRSPPIAATGERRLIVVMDPLLG